MKIIKPILKGPKWLAVGPLKCFKGNGGGGSSGGSGPGGYTGGSPGSDTSYEGGYGASEGSYTGGSPGSDTSYQGGYGAGETPETTPKPPGGPGAGTNDSWGRPPGDPNWGHDPATIGMPGGAGEQLEETVTVEGKPLPPVGSVGPSAGLVEEFDPTMGFGGGDPNIPGVTHKPGYDVTPEGGPHGDQAPQYGGQPEGGPWTEPGYWGTLSSPHYAGEFSGSTKPQGSFGHRLEQGLTWLGNLFTAKPRPKTPSKEDYQSLREFQNAVDEYNENFSSWFQGLSREERIKYYEMLAEEGVDHEDNITKTAWVDENGNLIDLSDEDYNALSDEMKQEYDDFANYAHDERQKMESLAAENLSKKTVLHMMRDLAIEYGDNAILSGLGAVLAGIFGVSSLATMGVIEVADWLSKRKISKAISEEIRKDLNKHYPELDPDNPAYTGKPPTQEQIDAEIEENPDKYTDDGVTSKPLVGDDEAPPVTGGGPSGQAPAKAEAPAAGEAGDRLPTEMEKQQMRMLAIAEGRAGVSERKLALEQQRSLRQRLALMHGSRGSMSAKLRGMSQAQDAARQEFAAEAPIVSFKERMAAEEILATLLGNAADRDLKLQLAKLDAATRLKIQQMTAEEAKRKGWFDMWIDLAAGVWKSFGEDAFKKKYSPSDVGLTSKTWFPDNTTEGRRQVGFTKGLFENSTVRKKQLNLLQQQRPTYANRGGAIDGPGTPTSDSIPAMLSDGEFVIKASAVKGIGKALGAKDDKDSRSKGVKFLEAAQAKFGKGGVVNWEEVLESSSKYAKGGEVSVKRKQAYREAIGRKADKHFHDRAERDAKFGGARRKFKHFQGGGAVNPYFSSGPIEKKSPVDNPFMGVVQTKFTPSAGGGYGTVVAAQSDLSRRVEELERKMGGGTV